MSAPAATGRLVLVPNTLDLGTAPEPMQAVLTDTALRRASGLRHWVVENAKSARAFLKRVDEHAPLCQPLQAMDIQELPRASRKGDEPGKAGAVSDAAWQTLLAPALSGAEVGLLSEAGLPAVADPGASLVAAAHRLGIAVDVLAGASSLTLALAASGLNGQRFAFEGYLPQAADARLARIRELEARSRREQQTQLAIETPYRNTVLLQALAQGLQPSTQLSVACGLTSAGGWCHTRTVAQWRKAPQALAMPDRLPAVFMWLA